MTIKALFVTHQCSGTGAPILLLRIMKYLREARVVSSIDVYAISGGQLIEEFSSFDHFTLNENCTFDTLKNDRLTKAKYDVVYFNTVETAHLVSEFTRLGIIQSKTKVIFHIHELNGTIKKVGLNALHLIKNRADKIICVSNEVKNNLIKYDFSLENIVVVYPFLDRKIEYISPRLRYREIFTVIGCGEVTVGKGIDIFIHVARLVNKKINKNIKFIWLGPDSNKIQQYFEEDIKKLNLEDVVSFAGFQKDIWPFYNNANLFFLSSRQDSFPLVCLEAASSGLPIIYFPDAGGIKEMIDGTAGIPLKYLDIELASETIIKIYTDIKFLEKTADNALKKYNKICSKIESLKIIAKIVEGSRQIKL
jgi:glycosyltransferase involved in cell wall biosynthesis